MDRRKWAGLPIQVKYATILTVLNGFLMLSMVFAMAFFIQRNYNIFMGDELGVSAQVVAIVQREQLLLERVLFLFFITSVAITFGVSLFITRKLTGPVMAIQRHLWLYTQGNLGRPFRLRKHDEFKELESLMDKLRGQLSRDKIAKSESQ